MTVVMTQIVCKLLITMMFGICHVQMIDYNIMYTFCVQMIDDNARYTSCVQMIHENVDYTSCVQ